MITKPWAIEVIIDGVVTQRATFTTEAQTALVVEDARRQARDGGITATLRVYFHEAPYGEYDAS